MIKCILCGSLNLKKHNKIKVDDLINLYIENLCIDVSNEFKDINHIFPLECNNCSLMFFYPLVAGSEMFYHNLQIKNFNYYSEDRLEFNLASKYISKNDNVLEVGSGSGYFASLLSTRSYTGLEFNDEAILKAKVNGVSLIKESIEEFSIENPNQFDVVCSFHVLEHVRNPHDFILSKLKALKQGGKLIISVPYADSILTTDLNHTLNLPPHHISRWKYKTFLKLEEIFNITLDKLIIEDVHDKRTYFEVYINSVILKLFNLNKKFLVNHNFYLKNYSFVKKVNRKLNIYKFIKFSKYSGKNILIIATKN
ncbi:class I SAM-dependent methyltransferase [Flavobacterium orientale]|uniref:Methyltransferase domain-containing protein n=1 Tax=Flavobacterium orientale TaxID=1756020 RepID=A0A916XVW6_9FLAO|nr:methyltransferase domain-containing protein [Flavobacterium orientale]GGD14960.1 hypothetical protein GCM10011343_02470 [Flavobacterium orientale]